MTTGLWCVLIATIVMLVLMFLNIPIFASIFAGSALYFLLQPTIDISMMAQRITSGIESTSLLACPFFIFAGVLFNYCGITERLMTFCNLVTGRIHGGLAQANILLSTIMGGMSGSNNADAAMEAKIMIPPMVEQGLPKDFSTVITAFSSLITPLIPPGICMILYGTLAGVSVGKIFTAGFAIGIFMCITMMAFTAWISKKRGYEPTRKGKMKKGELRNAIKVAWPSLILPIIIIGSIRIGVCTPSEAGAVAVFYALILGICYKELNIEKFILAFKEGAVSIGSIMIIVAACSCYSWILTKEQVPQVLTEAIMSAISNKFLFLLAVNLFMLVVGMFMEGASATIILAPILAPIAASYGINPVHFCMIVTINLSIGVLTPPVGTVMYVSCATADVKIGDFIKAAMPYYGYMLIILAAVTYLPLLVL